MTGCEAEKDAQERAWLRDLRGRRSDILVFLTFARPVAWLSGQRIDAPDAAALAAELKARLGLCT